MRLVVACPFCGEELKVDQTIAPMPGEAVLTLTVLPCDAWCTILGPGDGA